ncbi:helix-turn-helix transcriptional regulator [Olivibacter sp. SDN3]|uniref:AraC family transcriptional regulator n=1 Tax=Olivibacter sp. SDN3 TaxID=2764720 RepID=UPI0016517D9B|nr:AraC family transcriptional regulator [Olivibacter sp. SDN3]QNL49765.1 helix-turn-helix transcriptional regulator [Olivibacter sp. SDN3]
MKQLRQFAPLVVEELVENSFHAPLHHQNYYEIIYIVSGSGTHKINQNRFHYQSGDLFLISPEDEHHFEIAEQTHFIFIKFTDDYYPIYTGMNLSKEPIGIAPLLLMRHKLLKEVKLSFFPPFTTILKNVMDNIVTYWHFYENMRSALIYQQITTILCIISETLDRTHINLKKEQVPSNSVLYYLHEHIYEPDKLLIKNIATKFGIAPNYFSTWFKRTFDISYKEYINRYRYQLIRRRIDHEKQKLKQVANEFGFTDESHLSHFLKKQEEANRPRSI